LLTISKNAIKKTHLNHYIFPPDVLNRCCTQPLY